MTGGVPPFPCFPSGASRHFKAAVITVLLLGFVVGVGGIHAEQLGSGSTPRSRSRLSAIETPPSNLSLRFGGSGGGGSRLPRSKGRKKTRMRRNKSKTGGRVGRSCFTYLPFQRYTLGCWSDQSPFHYNEDVTVAEQLVIDGAVYTLLGVFDGHGIQQIPPQDVPFGVHPETQAGLLMSDLAAFHVRQYFHHHLANHLENLNQFLADMLNASSQLLADHYPTIAPVSGTTVTLVLIKDIQNGDLSVRVVNLGDSRMVAGTLRRARPTTAQPPPAAPSGGAPPASPESRWQVSDSVEATEEQNIVEESEVDYVVNKLQAFGYRQSPQQGGRFSRRGLWLPSHHGSTSQPQPLDHQQKPLPPLEILPRYIRTELADNNIYSLQLTGSLGDVSLEPIKRSTVDASEVKKLVFTPWSSSKMNFGSLLILGSDGSWDPLDGIASADGVPRSQGERALMTRLAASYTPSDPLWLEFGVRSFVRDVAAPKTPDDVSMLAVFLEGYVLRYISKNVDAINTLPVPRPQIQHPQPVPQPPPQQLQQPMQHLPFRPPAAALPQSVGPPPAALPLQQQPVASATGGGTFVPPPPPPPPPTGPEGGGDALKPPGGEILGQPPG